MKRLKDTFFVFVCVTTCVLFVTAVYITVFWPQVELGVKILWQILGVSLLCSIAFLIYPQREVSRKVMMFLHIVHYLVTNIIVLGCGIWFGWFYVDNLPMILAMLFSIAAVFVLVSIIMWKRGKQQAALMNERLRMYQQENKKMFL
ncbi:MAG: DUF3021 domain-containing protein [Lachnospiraceae bacterium]|nr:DUF3021 domain-containing protein [Lachnospiraceae bacterium]